MDTLPAGLGASILLESKAKEGESPVRVPLSCIASDIPESHCLRVQCKLAGEHPLKLNMSRSPIANKYREGKLQRTLKRELKEPEIGYVEGFECFAIWWVPIVGYGPMCGTEWLVCHRYCTKGRVVGLVSTSGVEAAIAEQTGHQKGDLELGNRLFGRNLVSAVWL